MDKAGAYGIQGGAALFADRLEAKTVEEQLAEMRTNYEEYFTAQADPAPNKPQFGAKPEGTMPKGETGAVAEFQNAWGFNKK